MAEPTYFAKRLYSPNEAAIYLGVSLTAFKEHVQSALMSKVIYIGTRICFDVHELDSWIELQKARATGSVAGARDTPASLSSVRDSKNERALRERLRRVPRTSLKP